MYAWIVVCLKKLGRGDFAKGTIDQAAKTLDVEEFELLKDKLETMTTGFEAGKRVKYVILDSSKNKMILM